MRVKNYRVYYIEARWQLICYYHHMARRFAFSNLHGSFSSPISPAWPFPQCRLPAYPRLTSPSPRTKISTPPISPFTLTRSRNPNVVAAVPALAAAASSSCCCYAGDAARRRAEEAGVGASREGVGGRDGQRSRLARGGREAHRYAPDRAPRAGPSGPRPRAVPPVHCPRSGSRHRGQSRARQGRHHCFRGARVVLQRPRRPAARPEAGVLGLRLRPPRVA